MTYFYIYKITLTEGSLKDHYYIGQHKTDNLNDGYKGSGAIVQKYYKKHPNGYKKEILEWCGNEIDLNYYEDYFVGDKYETDPLCLNLKSGGNHPIYSKETCNKLSKIKKGSIPWNKGKTLPEETCKKISEGSKGNKNNLGKRHSEEHNKKISISKKGSIPWNKGKTDIYSKETRQKQSESHKGKHWKLENGKRVYY